jgi:hypothetical protein
MKLISRDGREITRKLSRFVRARHSLAGFAGGQQLRSA